MVGHGGPWELNRWCWWSATGCSTQAHLQHLRHGIVRRIFQVQHVMPLRRIDSHRLSTSDLNVHAMNHCCHGLIDNCYPEQSQEFTYLMRKPALLRLRTNRLTHIRTPCGCCWLSTPQVNGSRTFNRPSSVLDHSATSINHHWWWYCRKARCKCSHGKGISQDRSQQGAPYNW